MGADGFKIAGGVAHFFGHGAEQLDGERRIGSGGFNQLERLGILFEERAGVDQIGGAEADAADFTHDEAEGQVGVTRERREEQIGLESERTEAHPDQYNEIRSLRKEE